MEDCHYTLQGGVGSRLWALCGGQEGLPWVWPEICGLWLEQSLPHHGAWCTGKMFLYLQYQFKSLPVDILLTEHSWFSNRSMTWWCYQMPSWSTCPMRRVSTFQSFAPARVTGSAWQLWKTSSIKISPENMVLLLWSTSLLRGTFEFSPWRMSMHTGGTTNLFLEAYWPHAALRHVLLMCPVCVKILNCPFTCLHFY